MFQVGNVCIELIKFLEVATIDGVYMLDCRSLRVELVSLWLVVAERVFVGELL